MSGFKAWMTFAHESPATNALVFATHEEATAAALELMSRWYVPTGYEIRPCDDAPNYTIVGDAAPIYFE